MTVIADISVPADAFEMGRVFVDFPTVEVELERVVPLQETIMPLFWVSGSEAAAIEAALDGNPHAKQVRQLTTTDEKTLFEVHWTDQGDGMVGAFIETRARILEATGGAETWDFRLRFETHDQLSELNVALTTAGIPVTLRHIYNPTPPMETGPLSAPQREALETAYQRGFFEVPRGITLAELAREMDISDSALSQRMRRGLAVAVERLLAAESAE